MNGLGGRLLLRKCEAEVRDTLEYARRADAEERLRQQAIVTATELYELLRGDDGGFDIEIAQNGSDLSIVFKDGPKVLEFAAGCQARAIAVVEVVKQKRVGSPIVVERTEELYRGESPLQAVVSIENRIAQRMEW